MKKRLLVVVSIAWLFTTVIIAIVASNRFDLPRYLRLMNRGQVIQGKVADLRDNNRLITYSYKVGEQVYTYEFFGDKGVTFIGKDIRVTYDPNDPANHLIGDLNENFRGRLVGCIFVSFIPTLIFFGFFVWALGFPRKDEISYHESDR